MEERFDSIWRGTAARLTCGCAGTDGDNVFDMQEVGGLFPVVLAAFVLFCFPIALSFVLLQPFLLTRSRIVATKIGEDVNLAHVQRMMEDTTQLRHRFFTRRDGHGDGCWFVTWPACDRNFSSNVDFPSTC